MPEPAVSVLGKSCCYICHALKRKSQLCIPLRGFSPNCHIFGCRKIHRPILEIYKSLTDEIYECSNWETEHFNSVLEIRWMHTHSAQFHLWEYINGNQTFIFYSRRPFICSVGSEAPPAQDRRTVVYMHQRGDWSDRGSPLFKYRGFGEFSMNTAGGRRKMAKGEV